MKIVMQSREFNHDLSKAKKAALKQPVFVSARGEITHVLMSIQDYRKMSQKSANILDLLAMPDDQEEVDLETSPASISIKPAEFD